MAATCDAKEMMLSMAVLILNEEQMEISAENVTKLITAANGQVESYWPKLFCNAVAGLNINDMMSSVTAAAPVAGAVPSGGTAAVGSAPAAEEAKKEEPEEEEDDDMGFGLFD